MGNPDRFTADASWTVMGTEPREPLGDPGAFCRKPLLWISPPRPQQLSEQVQSLLVGCGYNSRNNGGAGKSGALKQSRPDSLPQQHQRLQRGTGFKDEVRSLKIFLVCLSNRWHRQRFFRHLVFLVQIHCNCLTG
uniref:Uncharacterized protein n=1 Tax=Tetraselmis sp. GSL018 TaxID=582737 RepID=A0A061R7B3_9CHLO